MGMHTQDTLGLIGTGTHWLRIETSRHWSTRNPEPTSSRMDLPLSRCASPAMARELTTPTVETRFPGEGQSSRMNPI
jgi:hypothetical protein